MSEARNFIRFITFLGGVISAMVIALLLVSSTCKAQAADQVIKTLSVWQLKGLNTADGIYTATPDYAKTSINIDYSRYGLFTIGKRRGFDSLYVISGIDSVVGFETYQRSNRQSCLVYAVDDSTKGYGAIYATRYGSDNPDSATKIKDFWSIQNPTRFSQFNDRLYASNGQQQGIVWDGTRTRNFPVNTPGMPDIIPLNTSGNLNGEYRYCLYQTTSWKSGSSYTWFAGSLSPPVRVKSSSVLFRNFTRAIIDSIVTSVDSAYTYLGRTKANPGPFDDDDTIWLVSPKIYLKVGANYVADTVTYTDTAQDAGLSTYLTPANYKYRYGRDSAKLITGRRFGAPTFQSSDTANASQWRITFGAAENAGYAYMVTIADTVNGLESDSSRVLWIGQKRYANSDSAKTAKRFTIGLPLTNLPDSAYVKNIYRATQRLTVRPYIVLASTRPGGDTIWTADEPSKILYGLTVYNGKVVSSRGVSIDSALTVDFYLVATVPVSQTTFTDSIRCDSLWLRGRRFNLSTQPEIFSQTFQWKGKLGGLAGSRIWWSAQYIDSQGNFGSNTFDDFDRNDGDFNTAVYETQFGLSVKKNRKSYVLPNNGGRPELVSTFGCVAPLSAVAGGGGHFYVGDGGVYFETEGQQLERVYNSGLISEKLDNFIKMDDTTKRNIAGFWIPKYQQLILGADFYSTTADTSYVYDKRTNSWTTWTNLVPKFGCLYSKNSGLGSPPPEIFYFTKAGGKTIYTYATQDYDAAFDNLAPMTYETVRLLGDPDWEQVDKVGLITTWMLADGDYINGQLYDQNYYRHSDAVVWDSLGYLEGTDIVASYGGQVYRYKELNSRPMRSCFLRLTSGSTDNQFLRGSIEGFEIIYRKTDEGRSK